MRKIKSSIVAWSGIGALISFSVLYQVLPYGRMLDLSLSLAFGAALATVIRYFIDFVRSIREGRAGAQFLISAVFLIALVFLIQRSWVIILSVYNRPDWLVNSSMSIFIPWMMAWAVSLAFIAPDVDDYNSGERGGVWRSLALFAAGAIAGFVLATSFKVTEVSSVWPHLTNRAACAKSEEVWVSSNGIYHTKSSPYRGMVVPEWCFEDENQAKEKGFRPPKSIRSD